MAGADAITSTADFRPSLDDYHFATANAIGVRKMTADVAIDVKLGTTDTAGSIGADLPARPARRQSSPVCRSPPPRQPSIARRGIWRS